jgi:hypothetical protein
MDRFLPLNLFMADSLDLCIIESPYALTRRQVIHSAADVMAGAARQAALQMTVEVDMALTMDRQTRLNLKKLGRVVEM